MQYFVGQMYTVIEASKMVTGGGDGIEWLENRPFENESFMGGKFTTGQYTRKIYHLNKKLPAYVRAVLPMNSRSFIEEAWDAFPYCRVIYKSSHYPRSLVMKIETIHIADRGETENALNLTPELLALRHVTFVDILNDKLDPKDYKISDDPARFRPTAVDRQPIQGQKWKESCEPFMCCYKLLYVQCSLFAFGGLIESFIAKQYPRLFIIIQRQIYCSLDQWYGLTVENIREMENDAAEDLNRKRKEGTARGVGAVD